MDSLDRKCFMITAFDAEIVNRYLPQIKQKLKGNECDSDPVVLCSNDTHDENVTNLCHYYMSLCRRYGLLRNERTTLLSSMDQLIALQLCLAEKNKQERGEYDVETSSVIQANNGIISRKLNLQKEHSVPDSEDLFDSSPPVGDSSTSDDIFHLYTKFLDYSNYVDLCDVLAAVQKEENTNEELQRKIETVDYIVLGNPTGVVERAMLHSLNKNKSVQRVTVETPLDGDSGEIQVSCIDVSWDQLDDEVPTNTSGIRNTPKPKSSITESFVQLVYVSYLELLTNSRSELALARVINTPERKLTHTAFTDLKRESKIKGMTMYQTAVSFIMKIRLGGKGYAPDRDSPLLPHVKGLGEFVDLMHKLQTVIEEDLNVRSACRRVLNVIKRMIVQCKDNRLRVTSVESVCDELQEEVVRVINKFENTAVNTPDKPASDGGSMCGRQTLKVLRHIVDRLVCGMDQFKLHTIDFLCDGFSSQKTPVRFPSLLSQFRSPDEDPESPDSDYNQSLSDRLLSKQSNVEESIYSKRYQSSMDWAIPAHHVDIKKDDDIHLTQTEIIVLPSKTLVHPGSQTKKGLGIAQKVRESMNDQENIQVAVVQSPVSKATEKSTKNKPNVGKGQKRSLVSDAPAAKKSKTSQPKTCRRKLLPQVKGQQQLSKFFRV